jgi:hypothetical protein
MFTCVQNGTNTDVLEFMLLVNTHASAKQKHRTSSMPYLHIYFTADMFILNSIQLSSKYFLTNLDEIWYRTSPQMPLTKLHKIWYT